MRTVALSIAAILLIIATAPAQTSRGIVNGFVTDPSDAVVDGANVKLTNIQTSVSRETKTNADGIYRFDAVDLGNYTVTFSAPGFGTVEKTNVTVNANQTSTADAKLQLAGQQVTIDVFAEVGAALQTEAPVRGGNISGAEITELPSSSRNPTAFALTLPGVSSNRGSFALSSFSVNGARDRSNNFLIDGTENNDISIAGQGLKITNPDSVQEVSVQTSNYDSEFGRSGGAVVNTITKSGTNVFHGTLSYLLDSRVDDAVTSSESRNDDIVRNGLPFGIQNIFSGTVGGPIYENRSFFFFSYQEDRQRSNGQAQLTTPSALGRQQLRALFPSGANSNVDLYLNATANTIANSSFINQELGNGRGDIQFGSYFRNYSFLQTGKQLLARVDNSLSPRDQLSVRLVSDRIDTPIRQSSAEFPGFDTAGEDRFYNFLIANTYTFSPVFTNETRIAYNRIDLSIPLVDPTGPAGTVPRISITNLTALGAASTFPQGRIANNYVLQDTATYIQGNHTFRTGVDYLRQRSRQIAPYAPRGTAGFAASTGFTAFANFVDNFGGSAGSTSRDIGSGVYYPSLNRIAVFGQDRWKFNPDLTLTLGLRYEYFGTPFNTLRTPAFTGLFNIDPATLTGPFSEPNQVKSDKNNFAPSIGIAYAPSFADGFLGTLFGQRRTVVRAGYQIGYDSFFNNIASNAAASSPNIIATTINSVTTTNPRGTPNFLSTIPATAAPLTPLSAQTLIAPDLVNPYYQHWSSGLQTELPAKLIVDVSYVGSKGTKLFINEDINPQVRIDQRSEIPAGFPNCAPSTAVTAAQATARFPAGVLCPLSGRLDNLQGPRTVRSNGGSSIYHSGQLEVRRKFRNNLTITGSYTFSKLISNMDEVFAATGNGISNSATPQTPSILGGERLDRAVSFFDRTHRSSISYVYQIPIFRDQRGVLGHALGGFQISGITTFESGVPFTVSNGVDGDGIGGATGDRPNINYAGTPGTRAVPVVDATGAIIRYRNPDAPDPQTTIDPATARYIANPTYSASLANSIPRIGTAPRNSERTPGTNMWDFNVMKRTKLSESKLIEFRTEFYNIFNRPNYGQGSVSPFSPPGNPGAANFVGSNTNGSAADVYLKPNSRISDGGGRVIRYQLKFIF